MTVAGSRAEQKDETRRRILKHARQMVTEGGPEALTIAPLMSALGLTHGGFYAHFASREDLLNQVVSVMCESVLTALQGNVDAGHAQRALEQYIDGYLSAKHRKSKTAGCPLAFLSTDVPRLSEAARADYAEAHRALTRQISQLLLQAGAGDAAALSQSLVAELVGALSIARALGSSKESESLLMAARRTMKARIQDAVAGGNPSRDGQPHPLTHS